MPALSERKTAWDHVSSGLDSSLAAPLVLSLARLVAAAHEWARALGTR